MLSAGKRSMSTMCLEYQNTVGVGKGDMFYEDQTGRVLRIRYFSFSVKIKE